MNAGELAREAERVAPVLAQIWRDSHEIRKTERGVSFVGLIVPAASWIYWNRGEEVLVCERCGKSEPMKAPMESGPHFLAALADRLTPWSNQHRSCQKRMEFES